MISFLNMLNAFVTSNRCFLSFVFVKLLCFLVLVLESGVMVCSDAKDEESFIFPPKSSISPYPRLLHERDVIRYQDVNGQFVNIGSGTYANVTLGELRSSGVHVVIKSFRNSPFRNILKEIRFHRYVEQFQITPRLIGLLAAGPLAGNISLVYEYVAFSKPLEDWMDDYTELSNVQWLHVCHQMALTLFLLHQHNVLFNDLHRGNVLVQKRGADLRVYFIDFGFATYKSGKVYSKSYGNFSGYNFIAPEIVNRLPSTKATDVFALGYTFLKLVSKLRLTSLFHLAHWCMADEASERPNLLTVIARLDSILFGASLKLFSQKHHRCLGSEDLNISSLFGKGFLTLTKERLVVVSERYNLCQALDNQILSFNEENTNEWGWLTQNGRVLSEKYRVPLLVLDEYDLITQKVEEITWLSRSENDAIRLGNLTHTNELVIVKEFYEVAFEKIREEASRTAFLGEINVAPKIKGILVEYKRMEDVAFVQEFYGDGVSLKKFIQFSSGAEWDLKLLEKVAKGEHETSITEKSVTTLGTSWYTKSQLFIDLFQERYIERCMVKSYRRLLLERISKLIIKKMISLHESGYLINNFRTNNILIKWNGSSNNRLSIDIRVIDLGLTSSIDEGIFLESDVTQFTRYSNLAPEVVRGHRTSKASDVYSLCYVLYQTLKQYFPTQVKSKVPEKYFTSWLSIDRNNITLRSSKRVCDPESILTKCHFEQFDNNNTAFHKYYHMLSKCLHAKPRDRPRLNDLLFAASLAF